MPNFHFYLFVFAASGGYFLSMACDQIVAEELTLTGSIGVVAAKFNAEKLSEKLGQRWSAASVSSICHQ
jgi:ClpP class serine protease